MGHGHSLDEIHTDQDVHTRRAEGIRRSRGRLPSSFNPAPTNTASPPPCSPVSRRRKRTEDACFPRYPRTQRSLPGPGIGVACRGDAGATDPRWSAACEASLAQRGRPRRLGRRPGRCPHPACPRARCSTAASAPQEAALKRYPRQLLRVAHHARASDPGYALLRQLWPFDARKMILSCESTRSALPAARARGPLVLGRTVSVAGWARSLRLLTPSPVCGCSHRVRPWAVAILRWLSQPSSAWAEVATRTRPNAASVSRGRGHVVISGGWLQTSQVYPDQRTIAPGFGGRLVADSRCRAGTTKTCAPGGLSCSTTRQSVTYTRPRRACGALTFTRFRYSKWPRTRAARPSTGTPASGAS